MRTLLALLLLAALQLGADENYLRMIVHEGHAVAQFCCNRCNDDAPYWIELSLYPKIESNALGVMNRIDQLGHQSRIAWLLTIPPSIGSLSVATWLEANGWIDSDEDGVLLFHERTNDPYGPTGNWDDRTNAITVRLTDEQAEAAFIYIQNMIQDSSDGNTRYNGISHNCVDFARSLFEAAGVDDQLDSSQTSICLLGEDGAPDLAAALVLWKENGVSGIWMQGWEEFSSWGIDRDGQLVSDDFIKAYAGTYRLPFFHNDATITILDDGSVVFESNNLIVLGTVERAIALSDAHPAHESVTHKLVISWCDIAPHVKRALRKLGFDSTAGHFYPWRLDLGRDVINTGSVVL